MVRGLYARPCHRPLAAVSASNLLTGWLTIKSIRSYAARSKQLVDLEPKDIALVIRSFIVGAITLGSGRTNVMQGAVHLVIFAAFLFLSLVL